MIKSTLVITMFKLLRFTLIATSIISGLLVSTSSIYAQVDSRFRGACTGTHEIDTAFGCVETRLRYLVPNLITFLLGVAGLFFLIQILVSSIRLITASGNPQAAQAAREAITASVIAVLFIIFSVWILRFVGVTVFNLPGFFDAAGP
jgi:hypothetical protein